MRTQDDIGVRIQAYLSQVLIELRVRQRQVLVQITVEHEGEHRRHGVQGRVADHEPALVERNGRKVEYGGEHGLHDGYDEPAMDDKLRQFG